MTYEISFAHLTIRNNEIPFEWIFLKKYANKKKNNEIAWQAEKAIKQ